LILIALLTLLGLIEAERAPAAPPANRWAEPTRGILAQRCGQCHLPNLPTSVPRALAVFDLTDEPWYGRLKPDQYEDLLARLKSIRALTDYDRSVVESFVRCARDHDCPRTDP
jgi:mono/diheme cytochrome c family protein